MLVPTGIIRPLSVADLGEGPRGPGPTLILSEKRRND